MREISKPLVTKIGDYAEIARYFPNRINTPVSYTHLVSMAGVYSMGDYKVT